MNERKKTDTLIESIVKEAPEHGSIPFWSWNDKLRNDDLLSQIEDMKRIGMRGFFMHARGGLETEYFSDEWFDAIRFCIAEAKKRGMEAWAYDENGWPSGFGGGELLKDPRNHACGLECETVSVFPKIDDDVLGVYTLSGDALKRHESDCGATEYIIIRRKRDFSYVDTMDSDITSKFLAHTHDRYERETGEDFGGVMPGFFTDEPQYFRYGIPWSDSFKTRFKEKYGYDVLDGLPALFFKFDGSREFRYDYYYLCHESLYSGFMKPLYDWCEKHGAKLTGHGIEEWGLTGQMMCCGGVMPFYLYEHIPGIDYLGRNVKNISGAKQFGSVCEQTGKKVRLSETFAGCGWDVTPKELKRISDLQYAGGVNLICEHLYAYSIRGQRKRDFPNFYSEHNPWHKHFGDFEKYFANLGAALAQGSEIADTLVIHPIHSAYLDFKRYDDECIKPLEDKYNELIKWLTDDGILFHFGDESIMRDMGEVVGDKIRVGQCLYDKVVIPYCYTLDASTVTLLREYLSNGGRLHVAYDVPDRIDGRISDTSFLISNISREELKAAQPINASVAGLNIQMRCAQSGKLIFIANTTANEYRNVLINVKDCVGLEELCPITLERRALRGRREPDGSVSVLYDFADSASCLLVESDTPMLELKESTPKQYIALDNDFSLVGSPDNMITLDNASVSFDGKQYSEIRPLMRIKDNLFKERYEGRLYLRFTFTAEHLPYSLSLVVEPMRGGRVLVNGAQISLCNDTRIDKRFLGADITAFVKEGENTVEMSFDYYQSENIYRVLYGGGNEALRNCLAFDTEIEPIYLFGDFRVRSLTQIRDVESGAVRTAGGFVLTKRDGSIDIRDIVRDGYPFFSGEMTVRTAIEYKSGDPTAIKLGGRFAVCGARINGHDLGSKLFDDEFELGSYLKQGANELELTLCFSGRNLFGPHHCLVPEPPFVVPRSFSFEKMWNGDKCENYNPEYAFIRLGIGY